MSAKELLTAANDVICGKASSGYNAHLDLLLDNPSELKTFGSLVAENAKTLVKMLKVIHEASKK